MAAVNSAGTGPYSAPAYPSVDPVVDRYDADRNGTIDRSEMIAAVNDYLFGDGGITRADMIRLVSLYLFGL